MLITKLINSYHIVQHDFIYININDNIEEYENDCDETQINFFIDELIILEQKYGKEILYHTTKYGY